MSIEISEDYREHLTRFMKRRSRQQAASGPCRQLILQRANGACEICHYSVTSILNVHHIIPVALGGVPLPWNLIALCPNCHALIHHFARLRTRNPEQRVQYIAKITGMTRYQAVRLALVATRNATVDTFGQIQYQDNSRFMEKTAI